MQAAELYKSCTQCPRECRIDRTVRPGACGEKASVRIASAGLHFGEEPPLTVFGGSGTIFFTGCTLRCAFCQNYQISHQGMGREVSKDEFISMCLKLQEEGAENINLVTGSHNIPLIAEYLEGAKNSGLTLPVAWNSSAYESVDSLKLLDGLVDIFLPDLKTLSPDLSERLFCARNYPQAAESSIKYMIEHTPMRFCEIKRDSVLKEKMLSGVIVRHLFLPGRFEETVQTLEWLKANADGRALISLMSQYTPVPFKGSEAELKERRNRLECIENRLVNTAEDEDLRDIIEAFDFDTLFYQDLSDDTSWLPDFNRTQPFSNALAKPLWHWKESTFLQ